MTMYDTCKVNAYPGKKLWTSCYDSSRNVFFVYSVRVYRNEDHRVGKLHQWKGGCIYYACELHPDNPISKKKSYGNYGGHALDIGYECYKNKRECIIFDRGETIRHVNLRKMKKWKEFMGYNSDAIKLLRKSKKYNESVSYHRISLNIQVTIEHANWIIENSNGSFGFWAGRISFENEIDALHFKLKFG